MTDQKEEGEIKRFSDICKDSQLEWYYLRRSIELVPEHEERLRKIETQLVFFKDIQKNISDVVDDSLADVKKEVRWVAETQKIIKKELELYTKVRQKLFNLILSFAAIGLITSIFVLGNIGIEQFTKLLTGISPKP